MKEVSEAAKAIQTAAAGLIETAKGEAAELRQMAEDVATTARGLASETLAGRITPAQALSGYEAMMTGVRLRLLAEQYTIQREARRAWTLALDLGFKLLAALA